MGSGFKTFTAGAVLTASEVNGYLMQQSVPTFTNEAARDAAITSPTEGMYAYLTAPTVPTATGTTTAIPLGVQTIYNGFVWVCTTPVGALSNTSGTLTSTSYVTTITGDATAISVRLVTGTTARIDMTARNDGITAAGSYLTYSVSGATTVAASDANASVLSMHAGGLAFVHARSNIITGLTAGTNTFTLNYRTSVGTMTEVTRNLIVTGIA